MVGFSGTITADGRSKVVSKKIEREYVFTVTGPIEPMDELVEIINDILTPIDERARWPKEMTWKWEYKKINKRE